MEPGGNFNFQELPSYNFPFLEKAEIRENLEKWSMSDGMKLQAYTFDQPFRKYNEGDFLKDFLGCPNVVSTLMKSTPDHIFKAIGVPVDIVKFSKVKCTLTTLELFEKLKTSNKIVRQNGSIVKCMPYYTREETAGEEGLEIEIADNLRKILLPNSDENEDFEKLSNIITEDDKKEFLFSLFSHLVIGGSLCQYEDNIEPYVQTTKLLYKDLISVATSHRNDLVVTDGSDAMESLTVLSNVYKVHATFNGFEKQKDVLFYRPHINNFMYIIVNPLKQLCFTFYHHV